MRKSFKIVLGLLFLVLAAGTLFIVFNIGRLNCALFNFSVIDIMSLLTSVIIGFGLTYLISVSFSRESKKNEIIEESLKDIRDDYSHLMHEFMRHRNCEVTENFRNYVLIVLKNIDREIAILKNLCIERTNMNKPIGRLIKIRFDFSFIASGDNLSTGNVISDSFIKHCSEKYYLTKQSISQCKLELYNA